MNASNVKAAEKILGAVILCPQLAASIPPAIHARFSCYGLFVVKACADGWGIEGIRHALDSFGLDGDDIVSLPECGAWRSIQCLLGSFPPSM